MIYNKEFRGVEIYMSTYCMICSDKGYFFVIVPSYFLSHNLINYVQRAL